MTAAATRQPNAKAILKEAERLALTFGGNGLPIPLGQIAQQQKVKQISFRPLLVPGCLEVKDDGFNIYVNSDKEQSSVYSAWARDARQEIRLPGRMRFTIAHEIAHTLFYDTKSMPPRDLFEPEDAEKAQALESLCNAAAAEFLLPEKVMRHVAVAVDFMNPDSLRELARMASVSPETLVIKTQRKNEWFHNIGGILCVERTDEEWQISAIALHVALRGIFGRVKRGSLIQQLVKSPRFCLTGGSLKKLTTIVNFETQSSVGFQRIEFVCETAPPEQRTLFVTLRAKGEPWFV